jgi:hypothetical protein
VRKRCENKVMYLLVSLFASSIEEYQKIEMRHTQVMKIVKVTETIMVERETETYLHLLP